MGITLICLSTDKASINPNHLTLILSLGNAFTISVIIYFLIFHIKIQVFYESLLFFDEVAIDVEIQKAAIEFAKPIELNIIKFDNSKPMHATKSSATIFQLQKGKYSTNNSTYHITPQKEMHGLFTSRIKSSATFGLRKMINVERINELIKIHPDNDTSNAYQTSILDCVICLDHKVDSFFMPCGHSGSCYSCAISLLKTTSVCHLCRQVLS